MIPADWAQFTAEQMATRVEVVLPAGPQAEARAAGVFAIFAEVAGYANEWRPGSPLAELNARAGGEAVPVPPRLYALLERSLALGELTDGAFDLTWAALWGLWDFREGRVPEPAEIAARLPYIDYRRVELRDGTARLPEAGMAIGLGGVAKGWALDESQLWLRAQGEANFLLSAGGQVYAAGERAPGRPWTVGIRDPRQGPEVAFALLSVRDASVSTSGDYERFFVVDGLRYHHILDPRTGYPARGLRSATVLCPEATLADALSTAVMVQGAERGLALLGRAGAEGLVVDEAGRVLQTAGLPVLEARPVTP